MTKGTNWGHARSRTDYKPAAHRDHGTDHGADTGKKRAAHLERAVVCVVRVHVGREHNRIVADAQKVDLAEAAELEGARRAVHTLLTSAA